MGPEEEKEAGAVGKAQSTRSGCAFWPAQKRTKRKSDGSLAAKHRGFHTETRLGPASNPINQGHSLLSRGAYVSDSR